MYSIYKDSTKQVSSEKSKYSFIPSLNAGKVINSQIKCNVQDFNYYNQ